MIRVAALQFAVGQDVQENVTTCLRMIDRALAHAPQLIVLPGLCHHGPWYADPADAERHAATLRGELVSEVAARAGRHGCAIVLNVTLARGDDHLVIASLLLDEHGELAAQADAHILTAEERALFRPADAPPALGTAAGLRVGLVAHRDGLTMELPRGLALGGAQVLCHSLCSAAADDACVHMPARAAENHAFVVAANRVGPLAPPAQLEAIAAARRLPPSALRGIGESRIVAPDGSVLASAERDVEAVIVADIDPALADDKRRPDGSDRFTLRRPELYRPLRTRPAHAAAARASDRVRAAVWSGPRSSGSSALEEAVDAIATAAEEGVALLVLPALFCFEDGRVADPDDAASLFFVAVRRLSEACAERPIQVVTSLVERVGPDLFHMGLLLGQAGIIGRQPQLHVPARHGWARPGERLECFPLPWGKLAIAVDEDATLPEHASCAALTGAHLLACPMDVQEPWEVGLGLPARAAENRVCVAAASRPRAAGGGVLLDVPETRDAGGALPTSLRALGELAVADLHGRAAADKHVARDLDLLELRPWRLCDPLLERRGARPGGEGLAAGAQTPSVTEDTP